MLLDLTFRVEVPEVRFGEMQQVLADSANVVQHDTWLYTNIDIPRRGELNYRCQGLLVGVKEFHVGEEMDKYKAKS